MEHRLPHIPSIVYWMTSLIVDILVDQHRRNGMMVAYVVAKMVVEFVFVLVVEFELLVPMGVVLLVPMVVE